MSDFGSLIRPRIAITGLGVVCSVGRNIDEFASALRQGISGIGPVESIDTRWAPCSIGAEVKSFEPIDLGDRTSNFTRGELLAVTAAAEALTRSGLDSARRSKLRVGASVGSCQNAITELIDIIEEGTARELAGSAADAIARAYDLTGPRAVASNACAAGGSAIELARNLLLSGWADVMLAGGSDPLAFFTYAGFSVLHSLDLQPCSPYGRSSGLTLGEGAGILVLETVEHARARGATIIAELAGCGGSADGYHPTAPDPTGRGAVLALQRALAQAGVEPSEVDYVNGHGTGTPANDAMERVAFKVVFGERSRVLPISSTKSMIGHTLGAAGAIEAAACIIAISEGFLPPTINMPADAPREFDFVPNTSRRAAVRVAVSNNYAFGGSNSSLVFRAPNAVTTEKARANTPRVLVSGLGVIGGLGEGIEEWNAALIEGRTAIGPVVVGDATGEVDCLGAQAPELNPKRYASRSDWRKMNRFARMCVASTRLAWNDAQLAPPRSELDDIALVLATAGGAMRESVDFARTADCGADAASPITFPHTAGNASAGHVCSVLGIHGPMLSISQGGASSILALQHAADLIRQGVVPVAIVVAADELSGPALKWFDRLAWSRRSTNSVRPFDERADGTALGTVSASIILESEVHARRRNAVGYAELLGASLVGCLEKADDPATARTWSQAMRFALDRSQVAPRSIGYCASSAAGIPGIDDTELAAIAEVFPASTAVGAPKAATGESCGAAGAVNVLVGSLVLRHGLLIPTANLTSPKPPLTVNHVIGEARKQVVDYCIANASTPGAQYGAMVLGRIS